MDEEVKFATCSLCYLCIYYGGKNDDGKIVCFNSKLCNNHSEFELDESKSNNS